MRLRDLEQYDSITIQCHDNPDADSIGAGYGLYCYFKSRKKEVHLIYSGYNVIQKANLKMMVEKLSIPLEYREPSKQHIPGLLVTVDGQYGAGNVWRFEADVMAVIDHHHKETEQPELYRIQSDLGSCSTLVWNMLQEENYPIQKEAFLGTALYYGLYTDTNQFSELFHPMDMDMREALPYNKRLITMFRNSNLSLKELEIAGIAMIRYSYNDDYRFAVIKAQPCDPNILGLISDFLLQVDAVDTCVVYNEINDGYKVSVRSCIREVNANEMAEFLVEGIGSGGGHYEKAGGFISRKLYEEKYPNLHSEAYFNNKMIEYFDTYSVIFAKETHLDISKMPQYQRRGEMMEYAKASDMVQIGDYVTLRSRKGDWDIRIEEECYFLLETDGGIRVLNQSQFEKHFTLENDDLDQITPLKQIEYTPTVRNWEDGTVTLLTDYTKYCRYREQNRIRAMKLKHGVKVFPVWDEEHYMRGKPGDYLAVSGDDKQEIFIIEGKTFSEKYDKM